MVLNKESHLSRFAFHINYSDEVALMKPIVAVPAFLMNYFMHNYAICYLIGWLTYLLYERQKFLVTFHLHWIISTYCTYRFHWKLST